MSNVVSQDPLEKLAQTFKSLDLNKRIAAAKWLEGVIVSQVLTADEKEKIINASNEYTEVFSEEEIVDKVNDLLEYLRKVQKPSRGSSKKKRGKRKPKHSPRKKKV